jgi:hypothetical protein
MSKSFRDLSPAERVLVLVLITVSAAVVGAAERDLQRRPAEEVRGSKPLWRLLCLNALGAISYLRWGRR